MRSLLELFLTQVVIWFVLAFGMLALLDWCSPLLVS